MLLLASSAAATPLLLVEHLLQYSYIFMCSFSVFNALTWFHFSKDSDSQMRIGVQSLKYVDTSSFKRAFPDDNTRGKLNIRS